VCTRTYKHTITFDPDVQCNLAYHPALADEVVVAERQIALPPINTNGVRAISTPSRLPLFSFDLPNHEAAEKLAAELARKTGQVIVVRDEEGDEVCTVPRPARAHRSIH
jgi:hypothetical protein